MSAGDLYHGWQGLVFGYKAGDTERFPLATADKVAAIAAEGGLIDGAGHGSVLTPLTSKARPWTTVIDLSGTDRSTYLAAKADLWAATVPDPNSITESPYDLVEDSTTLTRFARVIERDPPLDEMSEVRSQAVVPITFLPSDPYTYTAEQTQPFTEPDTYEWTSEGWAASERWSLIAEGPMTDLVMSQPDVDGSVMRCTVALGSDESLVVIKRPNFLLTRICPSDEVDDIETTLAGVQAFRYLDGGPDAPGMPPQWLLIGGGEQALDLTWSGAGTASFTWREAQP